MIGLRFLALGSLTLIAVSVFTPPVQAQTETVLYNFCSQKNCSDGSYSQSGLTSDGVGNLYGTTVYGGVGNRGTVFGLSPNGSGGWNETVLHSFTGVPDGSFPFRSLVPDANGNLYGTTDSGGTYDHGTVFQVTLSGTERVLYSFTGGADGSYPQAGLVFAADGNLYGTTYAGGDLVCNSDGCGTVFKVTLGGTETVLHNFSGRPDGGYPYSTLIPDAQGNLYGTTSDLGPYFCYGILGYGCGIVFEITPTGTEMVLHSFHYTTPPSIVR